MRDFPGDPMFKIVLPVWGAWVQSLIRELDPTGNNQDEAQPKKKKKNKRIGEVPWD